MLCKVSMTICALFNPQWWRGLAVLSDCQDRLLAYCLAEQAGSPRLSALASFSICRPCGIGHLIRHLLWVERCLGQEGPRWNHPWSQGVTGSIARLSVVGRNPSISKRMHLPAGWGRTPTHFIFQMHGTAAEREQSPFTPHFNIHHPVSQYVCAHADTPVGELRGKL